MQSLKRVGRFVEDRLPWSRVALIVAFLATLYPYPIEDTKLVIGSYIVSAVIWVLFARMVLGVFGIDSAGILRDRLSRRSGSPEPATEETSGGLPIRRQPATEVTRPPTIIDAASVVREREEPGPAAVPSRPVTVEEGSSNGFRIGRGTILAVLVLIAAAIVAFWPTGGTPAAEPTAGEPVQIASEADVGVPKQPQKEQPVQAWPDWKIYAGYGFVLLLVGFLIVGLMAVGGKEPPWSNFVRRLSSLRRGEE